MELANRSGTDLAAWIETIIKNFVRKSPENSLKNVENEKAWGEPIVGFSKGDDAIYEFLKRDIGDFYWLPMEIISKTFPKLKTTPAQLTVISWVLPHTSSTKIDNARQTRYPSERWIRARFYGERFNSLLRRKLVNNLTESGFEAVAPMLSPFWGGKYSKRYGLASTWSERHAAYTSGLGTFGLCDGLITPKGKAVRCGSIVANIEIPPTKRPYDDHHEYCLFLSKGLCGECILRCPVGAISNAGHDKERCLKHIRRIRKKVRSSLGFKRGGCGLCQTKVPCDSKIPTDNNLKQE
ncbi:MAG: epoxyqueuosine reductase [Candidatus Hodarchaeota archaeon]